ncbi:phosphopantetheine-binding protein [Amycolatopsis sp. cg5]|uniref:phosphopantetheine-binding protein n=1 Tax=Amycolatopsis sp. cg5 TaxID=3238802 RepID=UPI0035258B54
MPATSNLDQIIEKYATGSFTDETPLLAAGIESLALLRLAVDVVDDEDAEIDLTSLVDVKTIGDLKVWLTELAAGA